MTDDEPFIDFYDILQVKPDCDAKSLERAYRDLAKVYHPDHTNTADVSKFNKVIEAYRALRNPDRRAEYDTLYAAKVRHNDFAPSADSNDDVNDGQPLNDAEAHERILRFLYKRRREHAQDAGVGPLFVQEELNCSDEFLDFHFWYLKAKGFIESTEQGTLAITVQGVDHVISMAHTAKAEKLRIAQSSNREEGQPDSSKS
jgi:curved DNA-binding protein